VPVQTIAPKFTGAFPKGIDYVGDVAKFTREFEDDVMVIAHAVNTFGLPDSLKLSVHSGSDKFSIYPAIHAAMKKFDAGISYQDRRDDLARGGDRAGIVRADGLALAREIYAQAWAGSTSSASVPDGPGDRPENAPRPEEGRLLERGEFAARWCTTGRNHATTSTSAS